MFQTQKGDVQGTERFICLATGLSSRPATASGMTATGSLEDQYVILWYMTSLRQSLKKYKRRFLNYQTEHFDWFIPFRGAKRFCWPLTQI